MSNRVRVVVFVTALASCLGVAICVALGVGGYYFFTNSTNTIANPLASLAAPAALNRIVYVGNDFNIYLADPTNGAKTALTMDGSADRAYNYPTWSPDNQRLAFVGYSFKDGNPTEGALYT